MVLATLTTICVASVGPAIWLHERGILSEDVRSATYMPVFFVANTTQVVGTPFNW